MGRIRMVRDKSRIITVVGGEGGGGRGRGVCQASRGSRGEDSVGVFEYA